MNEDKPLTLGGKLRALRIAKGLTQGELTRGDITPGLISQIESDRVAPSARVLALLADRLGVQANDLVTEVHARQEQLQLLKDARDHLDNNRGDEAMKLLLQLQHSDIHYISPMDLTLEIAYAHQLQEEYETAKGLYSKVEHHALLSSEHLLGANCMNRQGDMYAALGKTSLALYCYHRGMAFSAAMSNPPVHTVAVLRKHISICLYRLGNSDAALSYAQTAYQELTGTSHMQEIAEICHILSVLHMERRESEQALLFATDSISIYRTIGLTRQLTDAKMNFAIVLRELLDPEGALRAMPAIIEEYVLQNRVPEQANAWNERASCELAAGLTEAAGQSLARSQSLARPDSLELAESYRLQGQWLWATHRYDEATTVLEKACDILQRRGMDVTASQILNQLETMYHEQGQSADAVLCQERRVALAARLRLAQRVAQIIA